MVRQWQEFFYEKRYAMSYMDALPDFVKLAESYGHIGIKVEKEQDLKPALIEAFKQKDRTVFVDILTDPSENVFPMIPSGAGHHEMLLAGRDEMASVNDEGLHLV
jgi:acetolactate synthase-1/2/3 large subunit